MNLRGFVALNCGAIPHTLVESELFGYRKGAFSGAAEDRPGLVRAADGGTLLLDEVGDLPPDSQAAFLRVLQEREVRPVGATRAIRVDLRVVSASHIDLRALVAEKTFRADLEARLAGIDVELPPLRARREDLGILISSILQRTAPDIAPKVGLDRAAARALLRYHWPKNIRELEQALASAVVLAGGQLVGLRHLPSTICASPPPPSPNPNSSREGPSHELRLRLPKHLEMHGGNVSAVARELGKERKQIQRWIKRCALDPARYRSS